MQRIRNIILTALTLVVMSGVTFAYAPQAFAQTSDAKSQVCQGVNLTGSGGCGGGTTEITKIIRVVINILSIIAGVAAVIMIIVGGLKYITSGGDSSSIASAKHTLIYALVGLIIVALSQFIVQFVLGKV